MTDKRKFYGYYSEKQAAMIRKLNGDEPLIYSTPWGNQVVVTEVTKAKTPSGKWDDYKYCGEVVRRLRST